MTLDSRDAASQLPEIVLPPATPAWVTPELVEQTLKTWQPYYQEPLTIDDTIVMIRNVGLMFDALR